MVKVIGKAKTILSEYTVIFHSKGRCSSTSCLNYKGMVRAIHLKMENGSLLDPEIPFKKHVGMVRTLRKISDHLLYCMNFWHHDVTPLFKKKGNVSHSIFQTVNVTVIHRYDSVI